MILAPTTLADLALNGNNKNSNPMLFSEVQKAKPGKTFSISKRQKFHVNIRREMRENHNRSQRLELIANEMTLEINCNQYVGLQALQLKSLLSKAVETENLLEIFSLSNVITRDEDFQEIIIESHLYKRILQIVTENVFMIEAIFIVKVMAKTCTEFAWAAFKDTDFIARVMQAIGKLKSGKVQTFYLQTLNDLTRAYSKNCQGDLSALAEDFLQLAEKTQIDFFDSECTLMGIIALYCSADHLSQSFILKVTEIFQNSHHSKLNSSPSTQVACFELIQKIISSQKTLNFTSAKALAHCLVSFKGSSAKSQFWTTQTLLAVIIKRLHKHYFWEHDNGSKQKIIDELNIAGVQIQQEYNQATWLTQWILNQNPEVLKEEKETEGFFLLLLSITEFCHPQFTCELFLEYRMFEFLIHCFGDAKVNINGLSVEVLYQFLSHSQAESTQQKILEFLMADLDLMDKLHELQCKAEDKKIKKRINAILEKIYVLTQQWEKVDKTLLFD